MGIYILLLYVRDGTILVKWNAGRDEHLFVRGIRFYRKGLNDFLLTSKRIVFETIFT